MQINVAVALDDQDLTNGDNTGDWNALSAGTEKWCK